MSMAVQPYLGIDQHFDPAWMERIVLELSDAFEIRVSWDRETALVVGVCAVAGGIVGHYAGGRLGAAVGAGIASATGLGVASLVSLREIWASVKHKLQELLYIVFNCLRRLDPIDYVHAFEILMACGSTRRELVYAILDFIATKLGREVVSSITAG
ncbi:uncharacterized protein LOC126381285 [Pectinophora gossypiella]|uniref:uncharacterized protein LOC126378206 n=1 Tax=Pectinophora gossypiella TaxID=13191 RepID=UPI00214E399E|nr:uncharacterized protein LOC126378206 [Pectinophora gossypiella]XP_049886738.1 uncharacterized protein LOC126381285 [Pectinophora gossypiella]